MNYQNSPKSEDFSSCSSKSKSFERSMNRRSVYNICWDEIAKEALYESCVLPCVLPGELFVGCREIQSSILLYGPPGTGKSLMAKAVCSETQWPCFEICGSSCISKWCGESEKRIRDIFEEAKKKNPSIIFIDELDSLCCKRNSKDDSNSRRIICELLVQLSKINSNELIIIIGCTNRLNDIDDAILRRFNRHILVDYPNMECRKEMIKHFLKGVDVIMYENDYIEVSKMTEGWSGSDIKCLCREASMIPLREIDIKEYIQNPCPIRGVCISDFRLSLMKIKPVSEISKENT